MLAYVLVTGSVMPARAPSAEAASAYAGEAYLLKEKDGRVAVYHSGKLITVTGTQISDLPKADASRLREGISASTEKEMKRLLEDLCS